MVRTSRWREGLSRYSMFPVAVLVFVVGTIINPSFANRINLLAVLLDTAIFGFLVLGESLVILTGGIDLSVGNMASLSSVVAVWSMIGLADRLPPGVNMVVGILVALALCAVVGFGTGVAVGFLRMAPLIATLGSMWVVQGAGYWFLKGVPAVYPVAAFRRIFAGNLLFLPYSAVYLVMAAALIVAWLTRLRTGRWVYAVGGSDYAAAISGINVPWVKAAVYTASAVLSGFGGILVGAYSSVGYPRACNGYELYAIAAVVMGGFSLTGGEGNVWNALFGILVLRLLNKLVIFSGLSGYLEGMVVGAILVVTLLLASRRVRGPRRPSLAPASAPAPGRTEEVDTQ